MHLGVHHSPNKKSLIKVLGDVVPDLDNSLQRRWVSCHVREDTHSGSHRSNRRTESESKVRNCWQKCLMWISISDSSLWKVMHQGFEFWQWSIHWEACGPEFKKRKEVPTTAVKAHAQVSKVLPHRHTADNSLRTAQSAHWVPSAPATSSERRCSRRFHGSRGPQCHLPWL